MTPSSPHPAVDEIDCRTTVTRLWDYLDDELNERQHAEVQAHVRQCVECAEHFTFARTFLRAVSASWPDSKDAVQLRARVVARLRSEGLGAP